MSLSAGMGKWSQKELKKLYKAVDAHTREDGGVADWAAIMPSFPDRSLSGCKYQMSKRSLQQRAR